MAGIETLAAMTAEQREAALQLKNALAKCNERLHRAGALGIEIEINVVDVTTCGDPARVRHIAATARLPTLDQTPFAVA